MNSFKSFEFQAKFADLIACMKSESIFLELSSSSANVFLSLTSSASNKNEEASNISPSEMHLSTIRGKYCLNLSEIVSDKLMSL